MSRSGKRGGFTLLELLVVTVTIGILAMVSVPQYGKLVDRIRETEAVQVLSAGCLGQFFHFLEKGNFTTSTTDLAVTIPEMNDWRLPGAAPNFTWTITSTQAQIVANSSHRHGSPTDHQVRGTVNSDGTWKIEVKRPGENQFHPLGG